MDERYGEHFGIHTHGDNIPVFLIIDDLISEDWEIVDNKSSDTISLSIK
jgi:hypothetical protein